MGIVTSNLYSMGICKFANNYYLFDSHSRNHLGLLTDDGKACLIEFLNIRQMSEHLLKIFINHFDFYTLTQIIVTQANDLLPRQV